MTIYEVVARNTATTSENAMHHDDVAQRYGFRGGLVPGVDVYAYLTHAPAARWGREWLEHGRMRGRFLQPVYDGQRVSVVATDGADGSLELELRDPDGACCAVGSASLPDDEPLAPDPDRWSVVEEPAANARPPASPASLAPGTPLGLTSHRFVADRAQEYLGDIGETLPLYVEEGAAHPGWLLRDANYVLARGVRLGPWIHVESDAQHLGLVHDGDAVSCRALVTKEWEHKGHRFVELDVLHLEGERPVMRVTHTAIHTPRS